MTLAGIIVQKVRELDEAGRLDNLASDYLREVDDAGVSRDAIARIRRSELMDKDVTELGWQFICWVEEHHEIRSL